MKILVLSKKFPYPLKEGEPIAITCLSRSLKDAGAEVSLLAMNTSKHFTDLAKLPESYNHFAEMNTMEVDNRITAAGAFRSLLSGDSYILSRFYSPVFEEKLTQLLLSGNYDVVQLETVYLAHYIPAIRRCSRALVVMRAHNVEHEIWERVAKNTANPFKKWYLNLQNRALRRFELDHYRDYDLLLAITNRDLDVFRKTGYTGQAHVAPVGLDCSFYQPDFQCFLQKPALSFIGALDWMPNQEGVVWFLENVWPALLKTCPELEFHIAGKNTPAWLSANPPKQVFFHGETPSATDFLNRFPVMLAPLFSGSGIRIKILEGMALGRVVITTTLGKEGIPARHNEHLLLADSPDEFANAIRHFLNNRAEMQDLGRSARRFIEENFDAAVIGKSTLEAYRSLLSGRQS